MVLRSPNSRTLLAVLLLAMLSFAASPARAQIGKGDAKFTVWNLLKTIGMENSLSGSARDLSIYVIGDPEVAAELSSKIGEQVGSAVLKKVDSGFALPSTPPNVIYVGNPDDYMTDPSKLKALVEYTEKNKILSVTYEPILVYKGIALGIGAQESGSVKFMLNLQASKAQGLDWNKAFIRLAETI